MPKKSLGNEKEKKTETSPQPEKNDQKIAVIEFSGKQHLVKTGDVLVVDRQGFDPGQKINTNKILLAVDNEKVEVGTPYLKNAQASFEVIENLKGQKLEIIKYKAKSRYRRHTGYRSFLTRVKVTEIKL